jgi:hypothetical protein
MTEHVVLFVKVFNENRMLSVVSVPPFVAGFEEGVWVVRASLD